MLTNPILVINCGSSSLKFAIIDVNNGKKYIYGIAEYFNSQKANVKWIINNIETKIKLNADYSYESSIKYIIKEILKKSIELSIELTAIGHRIVHGGEKFIKSVVIDDTVLKDIKNASIFAPLHNPSNLFGIKIAMEIFPKLKKKNVAVFDTSFHQTMPEESYLYAIPYFLYKKHSIRRYGAHGISHYYVSCEAAKILKKSINKLNVITCHLGNGSSISAIRNGKCVDTSMGLTPLEGLVMGTRSGDIDPAIIFYLYDILGISIKDINNLLNKESGILGITGLTSDFRYIEDNYKNINSAHRAVNIYCHRLSKYIGSYISLMEGRLDAIIFTGGIGENSSLIREISLKKLSLLNININYKKNIKIRFGKSGLISTDTSRPVLVIPTNEELIIAKDTAKLI